MLRSATGLIGFVVERARKLWGDAEGGRGHKQGPSSWGRDDLIVGALKV